MLTIFYRGRGNWVPLLMVLALLFMMPSRELGIRLCQSLVVAWLIGAGAWVAWSGHKALLAAQAELGRPLKKHEWLFDLAVTKPAPFHSFLFIQMPWWALAYGFATYKMIELMSS